MKKYKCNECSGIPCKLKVEGMSTTPDNCPFKGLPNIKAKWKLIKENFNE